MADLPPGLRAQFDQADTEFGQLITDLVDTYKRLRSTRGVSMATSDMCAMLGDQPGVLGLDRYGMSAALAYAVRRLAGDQ